MIRRVRAAIVLTLIWAILWAGAGVSIGTVWYLRVRELPLIDPPAVTFTMVIWLAKDFGLAGAVSGGLFAALMSVAERNKSTAQLGFVNVALWGALASVLVPGIVNVGVLLGDWWWGVGFLASFGIAGAVTAALILAIARRGAVANSPIAAA
jgi:hypothetical protein